MGNDLKIQNMLHGLRPVSFFQRVFSSVTPLMTVNEFIDLVKREHQSDILAQTKFSPNVSPQPSTALNLLSNPVNSSIVSSVNPWADLDNFKKQILDGMESLKKVMREEIRKEVRAELERDHSFGSGENVKRFDNWRTEDGKPICHHCTEVGHIARYCLWRGRTPPPKRRKVPSIENASSASGSSS